MFINFDDFINESKKVHINAIKKANGSVNEAFAEKDLEKVLRLTHSYISKKVKGGLWNESVSDIVIVSGIGKMIEHRFLFNPEDGRSFALYYLLNNKNSATPHSFAIWRKGEQNPYKMVVIPVNISIAYILPTIVKALKFPEMDILPTDFTNSVSESESEGFELEYDGYEIFDENLFETTFIFSENSLVSAKDASLLEKRISNFSTEQQARFAELNALGYKGFKRMENGEALRREFDMLKAARATNAEYVYDYDDLMRGLRESPNGVFFSFKRKGKSQTPGEQDGEIRFAWGSLNKDVLQKRGVQWKDDYSPKKTVNTGTDIEQVETSMPPVVSFYDLQYNAWKSLDPRFLIGKKVKSPSVNNTPVKKRTLTPDERVEIDELSRLGSNKRGGRTLAQEARLQTLLNKRKGIDKYVQENDLVVQTIKSPVIRSVGEDSDLKMAEKIIAVTKKSGGLETQLNDIKESVEFIISRDSYSLIIGGQAGVGKTHTVEKVLQGAGLEEDVDYTIIGAKINTSQVFEVMYKYRDKIIIYDDCDSIFDEDVKINMLKKALDTKARRIATYISKAYYDPIGMTDEELQMQEEEGKIPNRFQFKGAIIFITNLMPDELDPALLSRSEKITISATPEEIRNLVVKAIPNMSDRFSEQVQMRTVEVVDNLIERGLIPVMDFRTVVKSLKYVDKYYDSKPIEELADQLLRIVVDTSQVMKKYRAFIKKGK